MFDQESPGVAVVGLENTFPVHQFQEEYRNQLEIVAQRARDQRIDVRTAKVFAEHFFTSSENLSKMSVYTGKDVLPDSTDVTVYWVTTDHYRARMRIHGSDVRITDLRVYGDVLEDPYKDIALDTKNAYWIVPFLFDGSRYQTSGENAPQTSVLDRLIKKDLKLSDVIKNDINMKVPGIVFPPLLPEKQVDVVRTPDTFKISYLSTKDTVVIVFAQGEFEVSGGAVDIQKTNSDIQELQAQSLILLDQEERYGGVIFTPRIVNIASMSGILQAYKKYLLPESLGRDPDLSISKIIVDNPYAILGRNPVRIVAYLRDSNGGIPTEQQPTITCEKICGKVMVQHPEGLRGEYYMDIYGDHSGSTSPTLTVGKQTLQLQPIRFVTNCKASPWSCAKDPREIFWYLWTFIQDKIRWIVKLWQSRLYNGF